MILQFDNESADAQVVIESDGRTCYAYLYEAGEIVGDVWLYNVAPTPNEVNWSDKTQLPFLNPAAYVDSETFSIPEADDFIIQWIHGESAGQKVIISVRGLPHAIMQTGAKPGWCRLATKSNPLAHSFCAHSTSFDLRQ